MMYPRRILSGLLVLTALVGCRPDDQRTDSVDPGAGEQMRAAWSPEVVARVDAGNQAIRVDSFDLAKGHFEAVIDLDPDLVVGWFGLYMAERGLGDTEAAAAALEQAQRLQASASLIHPENEGGGG